MRVDQERELKKVLDAAFKAFEAGDDDTARKLCRQALQLDAESSTAHSLMGLLYEREGLTSEATAEISQVVLRNPDSDAERRTLRRMRGQLGLEAGDEEATGSNTGLYWLAGLAAVLVFGLVFVGVRWLGHRLADTSKNNVIVASANVDEDLQLARDAFQAGRYQTALEASGRVLKVEPDNAVAKEIYDRSKAFLAGTEQPAAPQPVNPAPPVTVQSQPALRPGAPAVAQAPAPPQSAAGATPTTTVAPVPRASLPPAVPTVPPLTPPAGGYRYGQVAARPVLGYDPTAAARRAERRYSTQPSAPGYDELQPPDGSSQTPATVGGGRRAPAANRDSYIKVEVKPREPVKRGAPEPEAQPDLNGKAPSAGAAKDDDRPTNPGTKRTAEEQKKLKAAKDRQKAAETRRIEQEQGK